MFTTGTVTVSLPFWEISCNGGDSAGGVLSAACALQARDEGKIHLCF